MEKYTYSYPPGAAWLYKTRHKVLDAEAGEERQEVWEVENTGENELQTMEDLGMTRNKTVCEAARIFTAEAEIWVVIFGHANVSRTWLVGSYGSALRRSMEM